MLSKVLLIFFFIYLSNKMGPARLGRFGFLLDSAFIFLVAFDLGLGFLMVQKISRKREETSEILSQFLGLRMVMLLPALALYLVFLLMTQQWTGSPWSAAEYLALSYLGFLLIWDIFRSVIRGWERMDLEALSSLLERLAYMGGGTLLLYLGYRLTGMMLMVQLSILISLALILFWIIRGGVPLMARFKPAAWPGLLRETLPFGLGALCIVALYKEDTVMIKWLRDDQETGLYIAAFRLMEGTLLLPQAVSMAAYPTLSRIFHEGEAVAPLLRRLQRWLLILCLPVMTGGIILTPAIMDFFTAEYGESIPVLRMVLLALPALYLNYLIGTGLRSVDRQPANLKSAAIALVLNFLLNLILIPGLGAMGAALATVLTQFAYFALMYWFLRRSAGPLHLRSYAGQLLFCSAAMGALVYLLRQSSLLISVPTGAVVFLGLAFLIRLIRREDLTQLRSLFRGGAS
jgi:O-antigen/teichoic acid export membrane protein